MPGFKFVWRIIALMSVALASAANISLANARRSLAVLPEKEWRDRVDFEFIETSTNFIDTVDMQNGMYEEEALEELEAFENQGYEIMMGDMEITPDRLLNANNNKISVGDLSKKNKVKQTVKTEYSGLFD